MTPLRTKLGFIHGFYANHFTDDGRLRTPVMENVGGRLFVVDRPTSDVLAEFNVDGSLCYAEPDLYGALSDDFYEGLTDILRDPPIINPGELEALDAHEFKQWTDRGGTRPPLRKVCGPWVQDPEDDKWRRFDYRGKTCAVVTPQRERGNYEWGVHPFSYADEPPGEPADTAGGAHPSLIEAFFQAEARLRDWGWELQDSEGVSPSPSEP
jgi:hypothetical protein